MKRDQARRVRGQIEVASQAGQDWASFAGAVNDAIRRVVPFDRACWHPVDPGTVLFTGALGQNMVCSAAWLAEHEYAIEDVNKWADLARAPVPAGSLSQATNGMLMNSARVRSSAEFGMPVADELRVSFVSNGTYWAGAGFIRDPGERWFDDDEVEFVATLSSVIAKGFCGAVLAPGLGGEPLNDPVPGVIVLNSTGRVESISLQAEAWLEELIEVPAPGSLEQARAVQAIAAACRRGDSVEARARAQTRSGRWVLLYGTTLSGPQEGRVAIVIQPAGPHDVAPLVAQAYGLSERGKDVTRLCFTGLSTREIAAWLHISPYTVQDHFKSIFDKTGARSRAELVGRVFLEHYAPRFESLNDPRPGWDAQGIRS